MRSHAIPGSAHLQHRLGGLEKEDVTGNVSYDPQNHQKMTDIRWQKVENVADNIPLQQVEGDREGDLLAVSWGGTYGAVYTAVQQLNEQGKKISHIHLKYLRPFPRNLQDILSRFKKIVIPELNNGQLLKILKGRFSIDPIGINIVQGRPFKVGELIEQINKVLE